VMTWRFTFARDLGRFPLSIEFSIGHLNHLLS